MTAQLINVVDDVHMWSNTYDRELKSVFAVEDEIARSIVQTLRRRLGDSTSAALVKPSTVDLEAHDLYVRGRYFLAPACSRTAEKGGWILPTGDRQGPGLYAGVGRARRCDCAAERIRRGARIDGGSPREAGRPART